MRRLRHVEVAPFDAGAPIISDNQWTVIASTMTELGWYRDLEFLSATSDLLSNAVGVWHHISGVMLYLAESGYGVACYDLGASSAHSLTADGNDSLSSEVARALLKRHAFQNSVDATGEELHPGRDHVAAAVQSFRNTAMAKSSYRRRCAPESPLHEYSVSVFGCRPGEDREHDLNQQQCVDALLVPRMIGCGVTVPEAELPSLQTITELVHGLDSSAQRQEDAYPVWDYIDRYVGIELRSSWSGVVLTGPALERTWVLLIAAECKVQSSWYGAYRAKEFANEYLRGVASDDVGDLHWIVSDFRHYVLRFSQRLGVNAPAVPTKIIENLCTSSDLDAEVAQAEDALQGCQELADVTKDHQAARSRMAVELLAVVAVIGVVLSKK